MSLLLSKILFGVEAFAILLMISNDDWKKKYSKQIFHYSPYVENKQTNGYFPRLMIELFSFDDKRLTFPSKQPLQCQMWQNYNNDDKDNNDNN